MLENTAELYPELSALLGKLPPRANEWAEVKARIVGSVRAFQRKRLARALAEALARVDPKSRRGTR